MFYAALLLKTSQIPLFLHVGSKNTVNYGVFGHLTFKNLAICSGFCLPGHKNIVKKTWHFCRSFFMFQLVSCFELGWSDRRMHIFFLYIYIYVCINININICIYMCVCVYICVYVCVCVCVCFCVFLCILIDSAR